MRFFVRPPRGAAWFAAGAIALAAVTFAPATQSIVRQQCQGMKPQTDGILSLLGTGNDRDAQVRITQKLLAAAEGHPDDAAAQIVAALTTEPETENEDDRLTQKIERRTAERQAALMRLYNVEKRFPDDPRVPAALLINATMGPVMARRPDLERLFEPPSKDAQPFKPTPLNPSQNLPEMRAAFQVAAICGQLRDRDNAFFPAMHAVALLAENRDNEAIAALHEAAALPRFDDYAATEALTRARLLEEINGGPLPSPARMAVYAAALFPHYAQLRAMARDMAALATQLEDKGDVYGGFQIRQDISRLGARMRIDSHFVIGSLVGIAITRIAAFHADGKNFLTDVPADQRDATRLTQYITKINGLYRQEEAVWYLAELDKGAQVKTIVHSGMDRSVFGLRDVMAVTLGWAFTSIWLPCAAAALCFGVVTFLFARRLILKTGWARFGLTSLYLFCVTAVVGGLLCWASVNFFASFGFMTLLQGMSGSGDGVDAKSAALTIAALIAPFLLAGFFPLGQIGKMMHSAGRHRKTLWQNAVERVPWRRSETGGPLPALLRWLRLLPRVAGSECQPAADRTRPARRPPVRPPD